MSVHAFPMGFSPKADAKARFTFKLAYHDIALQKINLFTIGIHLPNMIEKISLKCFHYIEDDKPFMYTNNGK